MHSTTLVAICKAYGLPSACNAGRGMVPGYSSQGFTFMSLDKL